MKKRPDGVGGHMNGSIDDKNESKLLKRQAYGATLPISV